MRDAYLDASRSTDEALARLDELADAIRDEGERSGDPCLMLALATHAVVAALREASRQAAYERARAGSDRG